MKVNEILIDEKAIVDKVQALADEINQKHRGEKLIVIGVLKGCFVFLSDLVRRLDCDVQVYFMEVSSYGDGTESSGVLKIKKDLDIDIKGEKVLIAEDIIDSGFTLSKLVKNLKERQPASLEICAFLSKPDRRKVSIEADFTGFEIPDKFVVGYGLDCAEQYRQLPYIGVVECDDAAL